MKFRLETEHFIPSDNPHLAKRRNQNPEPSNAEPQVPEPPNAEPQNPRTPNSRTSNPGIKIISFLTYLSYLRE